MFRCILRHLLMLYMLKKTNKTVMNFAFICIDILNYSFAIKKRAIFISFRGCRMPNIADKFARTRERFQFNLAIFRNFLHFGKPNKSQTRNFNMYSLFYAVEPSAPDLASRRRDEGLERNYARM